MTWFVMKKQNARMSSTGHRPCRKKREPVKISTKPLTGDKTNREMMKVSDTEVTPANSRPTVQSGMWKFFLRSPSIIYGSDIIIPRPHRMLEFTVNMQKVRSPMWSKFSSCSVVRFMVTPMTTQTATTTALISALRHRFFEIRSTVSIVLSTFPGTFFAVM